MDRTGNVNVRTTQSKAWRNYTLAFREFARKARNFQQLTAQSNADRSVVDAALLELEKARLHYRDCRDQVAEELLPRSHRNLHRPVVAGEPHYVRELAELLWVASGRVDGAADGDWFRAEEIARCAAGDCRA